jgi:predicted XRE-type DNA-binding protein
MSKRISITPSSGNVFADLGLENADELLAKADLVIEITRILDERKLTQAKAAELLQIDQPKVSALRRGRLNGFSMERLYRFLALLGKRVEIVLHDATRANAPRIKVVRGRSSTKWRASKDQSKKTVRKSAAKKATSAARKRA